ncbi:MAG: FAD binding domain-containing protein [Anaerolineae bacterium]|jgi:carbon-monoxide dehydrogenase medium subunit
MSDHERDCRPAHGMTNSHLLTQAFDYHRPATTDEAAMLLAELDGQAAVLAGGTFLLVQMKMEQMAPRCLIDIGGLPGLSGISHARDHLQIGSATTIWDLRNAPRVRAHYAALAEACGAFGSTQIQLTGTLGGNICSGSPASDTVPALVALGAELVLVGREGERTVPVERFLLGPGKTAIAEGELLTAVRIAKPARQAGSAFVKLARVRADLAKASAAAVIVRDGDRVSDCRLALGAVAPSVMRARAAEELLLGKPFSTDLALAAGRAASDEVSPIDDVRSTAHYRRRVVRALTYDVLITAWQRAGMSRGDGSGEGANARPGGVVIRGAGEHWAVPRIRSLGADETGVITLNVNGVERRLRVTSNELLINVLRERLNMTGTKYGCGIGECGACTVHVDGIPMLSCLTLAVGVDGCNVTTVEGLQGPAGELDPIQEAFVQEAAFQCGYCTPGMLMMTKRLLAEEPAPDEGDIRDYLKGNRCRCTGFSAIVRAVRSCAEEWAVRDET